MFTVLDCFVVLHHLAKVEVVRLVFFWDGSGCGGDRTDQTRSWCRAEVNRIGVQCHVKKGFKQL